MIKASILILNFNGLSHLQTFLPLFLETLPEWCECIIGDNASTDGSREWLAAFQKQHPALKVVYFPQNHGFTGGNNRLLAYVSTHSQYLILLNNDIEVTNGWVEALITFLEQHPKVAAVQPVLCSYHDKNLYEYAGAAGGFLDTFGYPFCRGRIFGTVEMRNPHYTTTTHLFWASGAAFCLRKSALEKVGFLFNERFFAHMEEIDLCWRLQRAGYQIAIYTEVTLYHVGGGTLHYDSPQKTYLNFRNNLFLLFLNLPISSFWRLLIRLILDGIAALSFLLTQPQKPFHHFFAVIRAHLHFYRQMPLLWKQRKRSPLPFLPMKKLHGVFKGLIIWEYAFRNKKRFSDLSEHRFYSP